MALQISIQLPCKSYVQHYLLSKFGTAGGAIELNRRSAEGKMLFNLLSRARHENDSKAAKYTEQVEILLAEGIYLRHGWELTPTAITEFNNWLEETLKERFMVHVDALTGFGVKKAVAIRDFQDKYDFPEGVWQFETLKKYHDRKTKQLQMLQVA
jgi:hypothetical protein